MSILEVQEMGPTITVLEHLVGVIGIALGNQMEAATSEVSFEWFLSLPNILPQCCVDLVAGARDSTSSFHVDRDTIKEDLDKQRPGYPLSCYGPGKDAPRQLIEGPVELSPEELRLRYYTLRVAGNEAQAVSSCEFLLCKQKLILNSNKRRLLYFRRWSLRSKQY